MRRGTRRLLPTIVGITLLSSFLPLAAPRPAAAASPNVVISQVYGGGGNTSAQYQNDYVEIFNRGTTTVSVSGWSIQYTSATGTGNFGSASNLITPLSGSLGPGQYLLVQEAAGTSCTGLPCGVPLPTPDVTDTTPINMSGTGGKVAVVNTTTPLGCNGGSTPCSGAALATIVDLLGWGGANFYEGAVGPTTSNTTAAFRASGGCTETDANSTDFATAAPAPRNSVSPTNVCPTGINLSIDDVTLAEGDSGTTAFTFTVSLSSPALTGGVSFDIATQSDSATDPTDYTSQTLTNQTIAQGDSSYSFTVNVNGDTDPESNELFYVNVTNVQFASVADDQGVGTIVSDDCGSPITPIHGIQGSGASTPVPGKLTTAGIVVGDFEGPTTSGLQGFWLEAASADWDADPQTSEGIFVFEGNTDRGLSVGDSVLVYGTAQEFNGETELSASFVVTCSTGNSLPAPVDLSLPITATSDFEPYEGMLVRFPQSLVISEYFNYDRFGEVVLAKPLAGESRPFTGTAIDAPGAAANARTAANLLSRIVLDDGLNSQNPDTLRHPNGDPFSLANYFRGGDTVSNAVGPLSWAFNAWRIQPTGPADYTAVNPRPTSAPDPGGRLHVASQNTLNFFVTLDTGAPVCGPSNDIGCRGANTSDEFDRQRDKLIATLAGLDADIIGLNELENSGGVDPIGHPTKGILAGLNALSGVGPYDYIDTGTIGTDAIKVGLIYRSDVVTPVGDFEILDSTVDPIFIDTKNRPSLAQTFMENASGAVFTVVVNHLKSKGSACSDVGDPDLGDGQGNCSQTRLAAAQALVDWLATDPTGSGDPDFLIVGDLNSYAMEQSISAIKAGPDDTAGTDDDYANLIYSYVGTYAYSYVFDGQSGYLDHALSSASLTGQIAGATEWHNNSDEADVLDYDMTFKGPGQDALYEPLGYRSSDHDGVLVGLTPVGPAYSITINAGDDQSTTVDTDFSTQLSLTVYDSANDPVPNAEVTFTPPPSGASASVAGGPFYTDSTGSLVVTAHANSIAGSYQLGVAAGGASASFNLTNLLAGTAQISAGGSGCAAFAAESATTLSQVTYGVNKGKINALSEGTVSYWVRLVAPAGSNSLTVGQSVTTGNLSTLLSLSTGSNVYRSDCTGGLKPTITQTSINASAGTVSVSFDAPTAGTYFIGLKLSTSPIKGLAAPSPTTVTYRFSTALVADSTRTFDLVKQ